MRILHLINTHGISGAEKYLKHLLPGLKAYGIDCDLVVVCPPGAAKTLALYCNELIAVGIDTTLIIGTRLSIIDTAWKINKYIKAKDIRIVHSHLVNSDLIAAILKSLFNRKLFLISTKHGYQEKVLQEYEPGRFIKLTDLYYKITRFTLHKINVNVAVSKGLAGLYYDLRISDELFPFIHHGITVADFNAADHREECRRAKQQLIIVGRIELFKGHRYLIDALPAVVKAFPDTKLLVLGEGSEKHNCITQTGKLGMQNHVEFLGFKDHPYSYIANSDVIILPSLFEPFGLVYIEAFALKAPVVAFNSPAGNEIMEDERTALLVNRHDSAGLAEKIIFLLANKDKAAEMSERAFAAYKTRFTTEVMVKNTAAWYKSLSV